MTFTTRDLLLIATLVGWHRLAVSQVAFAQQIQTGRRRRELHGLSVSLAVSGGRRFGDGYRLFDRSDGEGGGAARSRWM